MNFPKNDFGLCILHNEHKGANQSIINFTSQRGISFANDFYREKATRNNELWTMQWYPDNNRECYSIAAPTFEELMEFAMNVDILHRAGGREGLLAN